jgi:hypothetical protein
MSSAADYITEYLARRAPYDMPAPWRHRNLLIRALWHKQARWDEAETLESCEKPSATWDKAFDAYKNAATQYQKAILDAWENRAMERGSTVSRELSRSMADHANSNERAA